MTESPLVSIITATYNRSSVLRHTIESVIDQTVTDWEMIVVGDACTDDTEEVVRSFDDPRVRFVNLDQNWGEQSKPNNEGFERSQGRYVAFLNHDDLWLADHLEICLAHLEKEDADMVFSLFELVLPDGTLHLGGASESGQYDPFLEVPTSSWLCRRELIEEVGGWPSFRETWVSPSQQLLFRAWRKGRRMCAVGELTMVAIQSGLRAGSYSQDGSAEYAGWARRIREDRFRERECVKLAAEAWAREGDSRIMRHLVRAAKNAAKRLTLAMGFHPMTLKNVVRYRKRTGFIQHLRKVRGLPPARGGR